MRKVILGLLILFVSTSVLGFDLEGLAGSLSGDEVTNTLLFEDNIWDNNQNEIDSGFQYEDYAWGTSRENIIKKFQDKNIAYEIEESNSSVHYIDNIFGKPCSITLTFTPNTQKLSEIKLFWEDSSVEKEILYVLTKKYGEPEGRGGSERIHVWSNASGEELWLADVYGTIVLTYQSVEFSKVRETELRSNSESEINRF